MIRKRQQIDGLLELPKDKRPPDEIIWDGFPEDLDEWVNRVLDPKHKGVTDIILSDIEG